MAKIDPAVRDHLEWLGFVQPTGLVFSAPALVRAGAILPRRDSEGQKRLIECIEERLFDPNEVPAPFIPDFRTFADKVLGWSFSPKGYAGTEECPIPDELQLYLPEYGETLRPDYAVRELEPREGETAWQLLISVLEPGRHFDRSEQHAGGLESSPHSRMERLLRNTGVHAGMLFNGRVLRLISAPSGESSGWLDFRLEDMVQTAGRPITSAMRLLLGQTRLLNLPRSGRLTALLEESRKFQNEVSERLAEQVLHALYELLRGFQAAHDASKGELLHSSLSKKPDEVYRALLTVILRLVFLFYAEERDMLPENDTFTQYYSISQLYQRLREDDSLYPDTMDQRYGAWSQLVSLFRIIYDGAEYKTMKLPKRHGDLFDPDRFPFLEGRIPGVARQINERIEPPLVPDGTIYRALEKLLVLDGERISYRALDVEQIGSVYETMMGFRLETASGKSAAIKAAKKYGAPTTIDLEALLAEKPEKRKKWIQDRSDLKLTARVNKTVKDAVTLEDLHAALEPVLDRAATPDLVPRGAMILQPSEERRRSGSHYTPRALTEPIVRKALEPILERLRPQKNIPPLSDDILEIKICDPAMGSGAFLVEACRQLGNILVESWRAHGDMPDIPPDEDDVVYARRMVAQRCLYGVDRNKTAVDLAKVSLWLITLARDHAFTFLDHALRHGDSLVGLSKKQISALHWDETKTSFEGIPVHQQIKKVNEIRQRIRQADENISDFELRDLWDQAVTEINKVRIYGDLVLAAFFSSRNAGKREKKRIEYADAVFQDRAEEYRGWLDERRESGKPLIPFHWEIEFPEVFERENPGFDVFVGNPPFAGKNTTLASNVKGYLDWLKQINTESHGNSDLVAHFFRRAFDHIREGGTFGLIATNTIAQGDTRSTGLRWICKHNGVIYSAQKRIKWPGLAAVMVSVIHVIKGDYSGVRLLDDVEKEKITAFLFHRGDHDDPAKISANAGMSFQGSIVLGMGFTFDDTDTKGIANSIEDMENLIKKDPANKEVIFPYIGGEEVNKNTSHTNCRYVINFGERSENECRRRWPDLMILLEDKVKPDRMKKNDKVARDKWWQFLRPRPEMHEAIGEFEKVLITSRYQKNWSISLVEASSVFSDTIIVFALETYASFCALQSRVHEIWARFFASSLEDRLRYTPTDCFETFPFPENWKNHAELEEAGKRYYEFRAELMVRNNEGLTRTYNRFHDPNEIDPDIIKLRELHAAMDSAVLDAYGWKDVSVHCEFLLDYEVDEEEGNSRRKKPWRFRWPDELHDEVLGRLMELNARRADEERRAGLNFN